MTTLAAAEVDTSLVVAVPAPTQLVAALDPPLVLEVAPIGASLTVLALQAGVLTAPAAQGPAGVPGPKGDTGDTGPAGAPGSTPLEQSYPIAVSAGQTVLPISPPPTAINGVQLEVNGLSYRAPNRISVSPVAVTWLGAFPLDPTDDVRVTYF